MACPNHDPSEAAGWLAQQAEGVALRPAAGRKAVGARGSHLRLDLLGAGHPWTPFEFVEGASSPVASS